MAENKLIWSELRRTLVERANVSEKDATSFLNAFQSQIVEALKQDKQVKINGLGTFRLQPVAARKSVDVNTGEEITIEGYNKIIFAPEAGVKELVEKVNPLSLQSLDDDEPAEIDPIQKLGVQAEEIVGILDELGQSPEPEKAEEPEPAPEPAPEPTFVHEPEPVFVHEPEEPTFVKEPVFIPEPSYVNEPSFVREPEQEPEPEKPKKKRHWGRALLIILLILLVLAVLAYFFMPPSFLNDRKFKTFDKSKKPFKTEQVRIAQPTPTPAPKEDPNVIPDSILAEFEAICGDEDEVWDEIRYTQFIATEAIPEGSRLTMVSYRYYGKKDYWPYIYDANKDHLDDPNVIDAGTPIRVPKLTKEQLDLNNNRTRRHLEYLRQRAMMKMR